MKAAGYAPRIRVLMVVPQYPPPVVGGLEKQAHELAAELASMGHVVRVLSGKVDARQGGVSVIDGVEVHRLPWPRSRLRRWLLLWPLAGAKLVRLMWDVDVVHAHVFSGYGLLAIMLARLCGRPVMVKLPGMGMSGLPGISKSRLGSLKVRIFKLADAVVAMSAASLGELHGIGYDPRRILATPNGIRLLPRAMPDSRPDTNCCRLVYLGRLHPGKGLLDIVDAVAVLYGRGLGSRFTLDICGKGEQHGILVRRIEEAGLSACVRLLGHRERAFELLHTYDALVLPSYGEGNSNVILEAMASALPVVSTRVGGTPMLVGAAGAAWLHEPGDVPALANLLERLVCDSETRNALGQEMRRRAEAYFDIRVVARTYVAAYRKIAGGKRSELASLSNPVVTALPETGGDPCVD